MVLEEQLIRVYDVERIERAVVDDELEVFVTVAGDEETTEYTIEGYV